MPNPLRFISMTSHLLGRLVASVCIIIIYVMLGLLVTQVLMRYFLGAPPSWTEELAIILFAWLVLLYATVGLREGFHVAIETIPTSWGAAQRIAERLVAVLVFGFGAVTLVSGISYIARTAGPVSYTHLTLPTICSV